MPSVFEKISLRFTVFELFWSSEAVLVCTLMPIEKSQQKLSKII
jgi:hypothetical protein